MSAEAGKSYLITKQYTDNAPKPSWLLLAETVFITLSSSIAFVTALSLNNMINLGIETSITNSLTEASEMTLRIAYVLTTFFLLFVLNILGARLVSALRARAQLQAMCKDKKRDRTVALGPDHTINTKR